MRRYRCTVHNIELEKNFCDECGSRENVESISDIYYCAKCNVPIYEQACPVCHTEGRRIASDLFISVECLGKLLSDRWRLEAL